MNFDFLGKSSAPAFCGCYPVSLPLPFKLVPINVVVPWHCQKYKKSFGTILKDIKEYFIRKLEELTGKGRWAAIVVKGAVAGHFIIFGLMFQTA